MRKIILLTLLILISCTSSVDKNCLSSGMEAVQIEWGYITSANSSKYYRLYTNNLVEIYKNNDAEFNRIDTLSITKVEMCDLVNKTTNLFFKIQSLNVPADSNNFIIYYNKKTGVQLRALWNPLHNNMGNKEFKELYENFMSAVLEKESRK